jgi:hypothetical protein
MWSPTGGSPPRFSLCPACPECPPWTGDGLGALDGRSLWAARLGTKKCPVRPKKPLGDAAWDALILVTIQLELHLRCCPVSLWKSGDRWSTYMSLREPGRPGDLPDRGSGFGTLCSPHMLIWCALLVNHCTGRGSGREPPCAGSELKLCCPSRGLSGPDLFLP